MVSGVNIMKELTMKNKAPQKKELKKKKKPYTPY
tara:strand:+ start:1939 stop:2040 length:102 start_codon:yes stop_codon:yes gene_type:complete